ncbi:MAG: hypothetical protein ACTSUE_15980, partial [Promethearchaeota archaeon]
VVDMLHVEKNKQLLTEHLNPIEIPLRSIKLSRELVDYYASVHSLHGEVSEEMTPETILSEYELVRESLPKVAKPDSTLWEVRDILDDVLVHINAVNHYNAIHNDNPRFYNGVWLEYFETLYQQYIKAGIEKATIEKATEMRKNMLGLWYNNSMKRMQYARHLQSLTVASKQLETYVRQTGQCVFHIQHAQHLSWVYQLNSRLIELNRMNLYRSNTATYRSSPLAIMTRTFVELQHDGHFSHAVDERTTYTQQYGPPGQYFWKDLGHISKFRCTHRWLNHYLNIALSRYKMTSTEFCGIVGRGFANLEFTQELATCCELVVEMAQIFASTLPYVSDTRFGKDGKKIESDFYTSIFIEAGDCEDMNTGGLHIFAYLQRYPHFTEQSTLWYAQRLACMYVPFGVAGSAKQALDEPSDKYGVHLFGVYMPVAQAWRAMCRGYSETKGNTIPPLTKFLDSLPTSHQTMYKTIFKGTKQFSPTRFSKSFEVLIGEAVAWSTPSYKSRDLNSEEYIHSLFSLVKEDEYFKDISDDVVSHLDLTWVKHRFIDDKDRELKSLQIHMYATRFHTDWTVYHNLFPEYRVYGFTGKLEDKNRIIQSRYGEDASKEYSIPVEELIIKNKKIELEPMPTVNALEDSVHFFFDNERPAPLMDISETDIMIKNIYATEWTDLWNKLLSSSGDTPKTKIVKLFRHTLLDPNDSRSRETLENYFKQLKVTYLQIYPDGRDMFRVEMYFKP